MTEPPSAPGVVARVAHVSLRYGATTALDDVCLEIPAGCVVGLIGPDGVGKSTLLGLIAGARRLRHGRIEVLGGDMRSAAHRRAVCTDIAYLPQGLGRNLYATLSVEENLEFFGRLFGHGDAELHRRIEALTRSTGLHPFLERPVGALSGGMKQKLGLCCALLHDPRLLILDEPTTGVDPLARAQFWRLIAALRVQHAGMSVVVATAYLEEADRFDWLVAMDAGRVLATGTPAELHARTGCASLPEAFIALLPEERRRGHTAVTVPPLPAAADGEVAIEARGLTMRFGAFTAVDQVSFRIRRGEIFGFVGSNGCGKTTTMKMLTGLLAPSAGEAALFGHPMDPKDLATRRRVGYMSQGFSLYRELTVAQNLDLHARLFGVPADSIPGRVSEMLAHFGLTGTRNARPDTLPLGIRQRLSLAVAMVHRPELLILDEPTSGVDPIARDQFWQLMVELSRRDGVTLFVSTHLMNEAARCDRIALMHAGKVLATDAPATLVAARGAADLESAFIRYLEAADAGQAPPAPAQTPAAADAEAAAGAARPAPRRARAARFSPGRALAFSRRESLELRRDPVRAGLALMGSALLMFIMGYGLTMDVKDLRFAVLDRDQTTLSRDYVLSLAGSPYFIERAPLIDYGDLDLRMRRGELALALEIPAGFGRDLARGVPVRIGAWIDGAMPQRAETVEGYVEAMHQAWLADVALRRRGLEPRPGLAVVETRFRYNPEVASMPAIVPAIVPLLLLMIPAMLTALSVVREKELGTIVNFYVSPVTRTEFLLGKQLPYVALGMANFLILTGLAVTAFGVPLKGGFLGLAAASLTFIVFATGFGSLVSTFTRSQLAAIFAAIIGTMIPAVQFAGLLNPVSSLEGGGRLIGEIHPATHMLIISRGIFSKGLDLADLAGSYLAMALSVPVILGLSIALLRKQEP